MTAVPVAHTPRATLTPLRVLALAMTTAATAVAALAHSPVQAAGYAPSGAFVQVGAGENELKSLNVGAVWPCACLQGLLGGRVDGHIEANLGYWNVRGVNGRSSYGSVAVVPMFRYRFDQGRSPWFVEAGIGAVLTDRLYETRSKRFSTALNFSDNVAVGYRLSPKDEVSLRVQHISNASFKKPNPGENFVQVRYAFSY